MKNYSLLFTALGMIIALAILHFIAEAFYFYWSIWWYDIMMHALGGFAGGLAAFWFLRSLGSFKATILALISVMIVGIVWEVFEYIYSVWGFANYWQDTSIDLVADIVGAGLASLYATRQKPKSSLESQDVR